MSIKSKAKRDAHRKKSSRRGGAEATTKPDVEAHADLRDAAGTLLGGIVRRDDEWLLGMDGKMVGSSDSAATMLALIRRAAEMHERTGRQATLKFSDALRDAANEEARLLGMSFDEFEAGLDQKMQAGSQETGVPSSGTGDGRLH